MRPRGTRGGSIDSCSLHLPFASVFQCQSRCRSGPRLAEVERSARFIRRARAAVRVAPIARLQPARACRLGLAAPAGVRTASDARPLSRAIRAFALEPAATELMRGHRRSTATRLGPRHGGEDGPAQGDATRLRARGSARGGAITCETARGAAACSADATGAPSGWGCGADACRHRASQTRTTGPERPRRRNASSATHPAVFEKRSSSSPSRNFALRMDQRPRSASGYCSRS